MPIVRVVQKPKKKQAVTPIVVPPSDANVKKSKPTSSLQVTQPEKSRIDYKQLTFKAQKAAAMQN